MNRLLLVLLVLFFGASIVLAGHYHVAVKGAFTCRDKVYSDVHVELFDYDVFYPDVLLSTVDASKSGKFYIEGDRTELVPLIPYVTITEKCRGKPSCWKFWIPGDYQWMDGNPKKVYHMGLINLTDPHQETC
ncbi:Transthyretin domain containing protein [Aphelenchoides fujianensis]|nr:Transthyretin domain containing protein [Aphelenchoides fujianensis]